MSSATRDEVHYEKDQSSLTPDSFLRVANEGTPAFTNVIREAFNQVPFSELLVRYKDDVKIDPKRKNPIKYFGLNGGKNYDYSSEGKLKHHGCCMLKFLPDTFSDLMVKTFYAGTVVAQQFGVTCAKPDYKYRVKDYAVHRRRLQTYAHMIHRDNVFETCSLQIWLIHDTRICIMVSNDIFECSLSVLKLMRLNSSLSVLNKKHRDDKNCPLVDDYINISKVIYHMGDWYMVRVSFYMRDMAFKSVLREMAHEELINRHLDFLRKNPSYLHPGVSPKDYWDNCGGEGVTVAVDKITGEYWTCGLLTSAHANKFGYQISTPIQAIASFARMRPDLSNYTDIIELASAVAYSNNLYIYSSAVHHLALSNITRDELGTFGLFGAVVKLVTQQVGNYQGGPHCRSQTNALVKMDLNSVRTLLNVTDQVCRLSFKAVYGGAPIDQLSEEIVASEMGKYVGMLQKALKGSGGMGATVLIHTLTGIDFIKLTCLVRNAPYNLNAASVKGTSTNTTSFAKFLKEIKATGRFESARTVQRGVMFYLHNAPGLPDCNKDVEDQMVENTDCEMGRAYPKKDIRLPGDPVLSCELDDVLCRKYSLVMSVPTRSKNKSGVNMRRNFPPKLLADNNQRKSCSGPLWCDDSVLTKMKLTDTILWCISQTKNKERTWIKSCQERARLIFVDVSWKQLYEKNLVNTVKMLFACPMPTTDQTCFAQTSDVFSNCLSVLRGNKTFHHLVVDALIRKATTGRENHRICSSLISAKWFPKNLIPSKAAKRNLHRKSDINPAKRKGSSQKQSSHDISNLDEEAIDLSGERSSFLDMDNIDDFAELLNHPIPRKSNRAMVQPSGNDLISAKWFQKNLLSSAVSRKAAPQNQPPKADITPAKRKVTSQKQSFHDISNLDEEEIDLSGERSSYLDRDNIEDFAELLNHPITRKANLVMVEPSGNESESTEEAMESVPRSTRIRLKVPPGMRTEKEKDNDLVTSDSLVGQMRAVTSQMHLCHYLIPLNHQPFPSTFYLLRDKHMVTYRYDLNVMATIAIRNCHSLASKEYNYWSRNTITTEGDIMLRRLTIEISSGQIMQDVKVDNKKKSRVNDKSSQRNCYHVFSVIPCGQLQNLTSVSSLSRCLLGAEIGIQLGYHTTIGMMNEDIMFFPDRDKAITHFLLCLVFGMDNGKLMDKLYTRCVHAHNGYKSTDFSSKSTNRTTKNVESGKRQHQVTAFSSPSINNGRPYIFGITNTEDSDYFVLAIPHWSYQGFYHENRRAPSKKKKEINDHTLYINARNISNKEAVSVGKPGGKPTLA